MNFELPRGGARTIARATDEDHERILNKTTFADMLSWDADFEEWAHKAQLPPPEDGWRTWLMMAGRGFGKTRAGAEWIEKLARSRPNVRIALVGATIDEARRVMVEGVSGVLSVAKRRRHRVRWEPSLGRLRWPNGSEAQIFSGDNPDGLRGPEHDFAWWRWRCSTWPWPRQWKAPRKTILRRPPRPVPATSSAKRRQGSGFNSRPTSRVMGVAGGGSSRPRLECRLS